MAHQPSEYCDCTECSLRKALERSVAENERIRGELTTAHDVLRRMLAVYEALMPGVRYISVKDYAELNNAPIAARLALYHPGPPKMRLVMASVGEDFPKEQARCREVLQQYKELGPAGVLGGMMIEATLREADEAMASGDIVRILQAYTAMQGVE